MLTTLNPLTVEEVFNSRFPKIFIDRVAYEERIDLGNQENSMLDLSISSHIFDFKNVDERFNILEDEELLSSLVVNFLFVYSEEYDQLTADKYYMLSDEWLKNVGQYRKFKFSLREMLAFDLAETDKLAKSVLFEQTDTNIFSVPFKTSEFSVPVTFSDSFLSQQNMTMFAFFSLDEDELNLNRSSINKGLLSTYFGGVNIVELIRSSTLNISRLALFNPETEKYWQKDAIYTTTDIPKAVPDFSPAEVANKYLDLVRSIKKEMEPRLKRQQADFIANITTPYYSTPKDSYFVREVSKKVENLLVDNVGNEFRTRTVRRLVSFLSGVDAQLEGYPTLELRMIGDGRIQKKTISFLEQTELGRTTEEFTQLKDYLTPRAKSFCVSEAFYASDDDGSVEFYTVLNKTNMMRIYSPFYMYFPNFETLIPEVRSLFSIKEIEVTRDHAFAGNTYNPDIGGALPENTALPVGTFLFSHNEQAIRLNDFDTFIGTFTGRRERTVLQVFDEVEETITGVVGESETTTETGRETEVQESIYETVDAITTGVAAKLYRPNQNEDELILISLNDQSVNASEETSTSNLLVSSEDPLDEEDGNLQLFLHYRVSLSYIDRTGLFLADQLQSLNVSINELEVYLEEATEKCAFNDITDVFNDYFIDQQYRKYSDLRMAPWNKLSSVFSYMMAIFNKVEITDQEIIQRNAIEIKKLLDPKTATLGSIQVVLDSVRIFASNLRRILVSIGAIKAIPEVKGLVETPMPINDQIEIIGQPALTNWFRPRLSQYTGVQRLPDEVTTIDERELPTIAADDAVGLFVQAFSPRFKTWWNNIDTTKDNTQSSFKKLQTVAKYIVNNRTSFNLSDSLPGKGALKLRFIRPWRNRSQRTDWRNKSVDVVVASETSREYENGGRLTISLADFNSDSYELNTGNSSANRAMQRLCHLMMTAETLIGDFGGGSEQIKMVRPNKESKSDMYYKDDGYGANNSQFLLFYKSNNKVATKGSHSDHLTSNAKSILNSQVFKNNRSGVADRDGLYYTSTDNITFSSTTIKITFGELRLIYLQTISDVYESFFIDGKDIMPDIERAITVEFAEGVTAAESLINEAFRKIYNSGFYPWPGYPEIPDSLDASKDDLFG